MTGRQRRDHHHLRCSSPNNVCGAGVTYRRQVPSSRPRWSSAGFAQRQTVRRESNCRCSGTRRRVASCVHRAAAGSVWLFPFEISWSGDPDQGEHRLVVRSVSELMISSGTAFLSEAVALYFERKRPILPKSSLASFWNQRRKIIYCSETFPKEI